MNGRVRSTRGGEETGRENMHSLIAYQSDIFQGKEKLGAATCFAGTVAEKRE